MKLIPIEEFAYPNPVFTGVGSKNTISNGPDDGTLNKMAATFWNPMRHGTSGGAIGNGLTAFTLEAALSTGELNIGGHGNKGFFETGMGQTGPFNMNTFVGWNESAWGPELDRIQPAPVTQISIWACHTGEGQEGADLLFAMAKRCGRAVRAGTGFLLTNGQSTWWENGTVWQVATPTNKPAPIGPPTPHTLMSDSVKFEAEGAEYEVDEVAGCEISTQQFGKKGVSPKIIHASVVKEVVAKWFISSALDMKVSVAGFVTATIRISFVDGRAISFEVFNDRLAVDKTTGIGYYISSLTTFASMLE